MYTKETKKVMLAIMFLWGTFWKFRNCLDWWIQGISKWRCNDQGSFDWVLLSFGRRYFSYDLSLLSNTETFGGDLYLRDQHYIQMKWQISKLGWTMNQYQWRGRKSPLTPLILKSSYQIDYTIQHIKLYHHILICSLIKMLE